MPSPTKWNAAEFVAWDGEAITEGPEVINGRGVYNLLSNSDGKYLHEDSGLRTRDCLEFFLECRRPKTTNVIFGGMYDFNMILQDLKHDHLKELWTWGALNWGGYRIRLQPRKMLSVKRLREKSKKAKAFVLWDVWTFFGSSFENACLTWLEADHRDMVELARMKRLRPNFTKEDFNMIFQYNAMENRLLVELMDRVRATVDTLGLKLNRWDGVGSLAGALMREHNVMEWSPRVEDIPLDLYQLFQQAYAGGRIEDLMIGNHEGPIWNYDLRSAYPAAAVDLPALKDMVWEEAAYPDETADIALVLVEWHYKREMPFYPFFYREFDCTIKFPRWGRGVYWREEVEAARIVHEEGVDFRILRAWNGYAAWEHQPLAFLGDLYERRAVLKREGNQAQITVKLAMNSIYGKFAQQKGYKAPTRNEPARYPPTHNLAYAGLITARTRAKLYEAAICNPSEIICFATDGIYSRAPLEGLSTEENILGTWEENHYDAMTIAQSGVYWLLKDGEWESRYRGFDKDSLTRDDVIHAWKSGETTVKGQVTRFIGMGAALMRDDFEDIWRTWPTEPRIMNLEPEGKRMLSVTSPPLTDAATQLIPTKSEFIWDMVDYMSHPSPVIWMDPVQAEARNFYYALDDEREEEEEGFQ